MSSAYETDEETVSPLRNIGTATGSRNQIAGVKTQSPNR